MIYLQLVQAFFIIGLFCFGGGYAALPLIQQKIVEDAGWITAAEFVDLTTISQMTPGPIGINAATFVGMQTAGFLGAICATLGFVLPSVIIVLIISHFYFKYRSMKIMQGVLTGLRPAVVALIVKAAWSIVREALWAGQALGLSTLNIVAVIMTIIATVVLFKTKLGPISIIICSGVVGVVVYGFAGL